MSSFFFFSETSEELVFGEIEPHNAIEFLKIIASVTFSRLLKENSLLFKADTVKTFLAERCEKFTFEKFKASPSLYAQYLVICNNIKIVSLLLECDCIDSGILSEKEWQSPIFDLMDIPEEPAYLFLAPSFSNTHREVSNGRLW